MRFRKIVYLRYFPLTEHIYYDLYLDNLQKEGFEVEYVDIKALFFPDQEMEEYKGFNNVVKMYSYHELKKYLLQQTPNTLIISIMTFENRVIKVFKLLSRCECKTAVFARGVFPLLPEINKEKEKIDKHNNTLLQIINLIKKATQIKRLLRRLYFNLNAKFFKEDGVALKKDGKIKPYDFVFKAGIEGIRGLGHGYEIDNQVSKLVEVNTIDYDSYLVKKEGKSLVNYPYIVFLDQCLPYHPDAKALNIRTVNHDSYYIELNRFFDQIEEIYQLKIVVAAHPKSPPYKNFNPFNEREFFLNSTCELVRNSEFVLSHSSTSICFPILFKKPILFIDSNEIENALPNHSIMMKYLSEILGCLYTRYDEEFKNRTELRYSSEKYSKYKYLYLSSEKSENKLSCDIFIDFLKDK